MVGLSDGDTVGEPDSTGDVVGRLVFGGDVGDTDGDPVGATRVT